MRLLFPLTALLFGVSTTVTMAGTQDVMPLTYDVFEAAIPHVDLADCPASLAGEDIFCRATLASDAIHVFAFTEDNDSPLVGFATFETDSMAELLK